jgi:hypothetical protein
MGRASALIVLTLLGCASGGGRTALGWSLGGEAHVFVTGTAFARDLYRELTGSRRLADSLARRSLIAVTPRAGRVATVLSASGAAPARLTLARFHTAASCGAEEVVTELVLAFPPSGAAGRSAPPSHVTVVALLDAPPFAGGAGLSARPLSRRDAVELVTRVVQRAERRASLIGPLALDPDRAADAGEVVPIGRTHYAIGFRARFVAGERDTTLVTGAAISDTALSELRWIVGPMRARLEGGMIKGARYSLRGTVPGPGGGPLLLLDEIADVSPRASRAMVIDPATRRVLATQPLALRCP